MQYLVGHDVYSSFPVYRQALKDFLKRPDATEALADNPMMQTDLLDVYLAHYHPDLSTGKSPPEREDITTIVVTIHPEWGSAGFGVLLTDGSCESFSLKKLKLAPRPPASTPTATRGQRTRNVYDAFRLGARPSIARWIAEVEPPERCPVTDILLAPLHLREDPVRRYDPDLPTVEHHQPSFRELVAQFLEQESLTTSSVPLIYNYALRVWELEGEDLQQRWRQHHDTGELRWISLEANRLLNQQEQQDRA